MIIAWGLFIPSILFFLMYLIVIPSYNKDVEEGNYKPKKVYVDNDEVIILISYIVAICSAQYIWG